MILSNAGVMDDYLSRKLWGRLTLDDLVRRCAEKTPEQLAVVDLLGRAKWTDGESCSLTYAELDRQVSAVARLFEATGLPKDSVVATQMPPTVEAVILFYGILRAGLVAAPMPIYWRNSDIIEALMPVSPKAFIGAARIGDDRPAERLMHVAAEMFSVRFVGAFGDETPDGVVRFSDAIEDDIHEEAFEFRRKDNNRACHVASLTWSSDMHGRPIVVARHHNHWIATALAHILEGGIKPQASLLSPYVPTGIVGIGSAMVSALLSSGTLYLHHFGELSALIEQVKNYRPNALFIPEALFKIISQSCYDFDPQLIEDMTVFAVRNAGKLTSCDNQDDDRKVVIVHEINEIAAIPLMNKNALPIGEISYPHHAKEGTVLVECRIRGHKQAARQVSMLGGEMTLRGPAIVDADYPLGEGGHGLVIGENGFVETAIGCRITHTEPPNAEPIGQVGDLIMLGGAILSVEELDHLYSQHSKIMDAAAFSIPDRVLGARLCVAVVLKPNSHLNLDEFIQFLHEKQVSLHKIPSQFVVVSSIPRGASGAILRPHLIDAIAA